MATNRSHPALRPFAAVAGCRDRHSGGCRRLRICDHHVDDAGYRDDHVNEINDITIWYPYNRSSPSRCGHAKDPPRESDTTNGRLDDTALGSPRWIWL